MNLVHGFLLLIFLYDYHFKNVGFLGEIVVSSLFSKLRLNYYTRTRILNKVITILSWGNDNYRGLQLFACKMYEQNIQQLLVEKRV